jgi:trimeric autotransporter adhesin
MRKICMASILVLVSAISSFAQVTTNSGSGLAATYPDLASAITALNAATITSPVVITLAGNETAPVGGYSITAQGSAANTIIIEGSASTITASGALVAGTLTDAIFKLTGADYVTLRNFTMLENAANTITAAATNNMTEWGVALLYATTTNGAQNCTIQGNTITLNRTYQNTFGIYSNSTHSATVPATAATATTTAGGNSGLKIYGNTISNINNGIVVVGPTAAADFNTGIDIGGTGGAEANTISNYGTTGTFSSCEKLNRV